MNKLAKNKSLLWVTWGALVFTSCLREPTKETATLPTPTPMHNTTPGRVAESTLRPIKNSPRVDSLILYYGLDLKNAFEHREDQSNLTAIEKVLARSEVQHETALLVSLNFYLGLLHSGRREYDDALRYWTKMEKIAQSDKVQFKNFLTFMYNVAANTYAGVKKNYTEAMRMWKILAEEHQGTGSSMEKNINAAHAVIMIGRHIRYLPGQADDLKKYLIETSKKHRNEVGYAALASLYDLSKEAGDQQKANQYLIEMNSYPSTPEYKTYSEPILKKWKQIDAKNEWN